MTKKCFAKKSFVENQKYAPKKRTQTQNKSQNQNKKNKIKNETMKTKRMDLCVFNELINSFMSVKH